MSKDIFSFQNDSCQESAFEFMQRDYLLMFTLKHTKYLVPCRPEKDQKAGEMFKSAILISPQGERFIPAFTHPDEMVKWPYEKEKAMLQTFENLKLMVMNYAGFLSGIIINPFTLPLTLRPEQIRKIDHVTESGCVENGKQTEAICFLRPKQLSLKMDEGLKAFFRQREEVYSVYLMLALDLGNRNPRRIFLIDFDGERTALFSEAKKAINTYMPAGEDFELMKATYDTLQAASRTGRLLYKKELVAGGLTQRNS